MKLLYIIDKMHHSAGMERILSSKMNYLAKCPDFSVAFSTYEQEGSPMPFALDASIGYYPLEARIATRQTLSFLSWMVAYRRSRQRMARQLRNLLAMLRPDAVVVTVYSFSVLDVIIRESVGVGARVVLESHTDSSTVLMAHKYGYQRMLRSLMHVWDRHILHSVSLCRCVVCLTPEDARFWEAYNGKVSVIPNMVSTQKASEADYDSRRVIAVGRYSYEKGYDLLLDIWSKVSAQCSGWHLHIFGDGDRTQVEDKVQQLGLSECVHAHGSVPDIASEYARSSICLVTSRYEGFSLVLAEAMSCGLPAVAFDCPHGPRHIITEGKDGFLIPMGDIDAFARQLMSLMNETALRQRMGEAAGESATARFSMEGVMAQWKRLFQGMND